MKIKFNNVTEIAFDMYNSNKQIHVCGMRNIYLEQMETFSAFISQIDEIQLYEAYMMPVCKLPAAYEK